MLLTLLLLLLRILRLIKVVHIWNKNITTLQGTINNNVALKVDTTALSLYYSILIIDNLINAVYDAIGLKADASTSTSSYCTYIAINALLTTKILL